MLSIFRHLMKNEHGATAIEYVLIASLISVAPIIIAFFLAQRHFVEGISMSGFK